MLLATKHVVVRGFEIELDALVLVVSPTWRKSRCSGCGVIRPGYDTKKPRDWRHLNFGEISVYLRYAPRQVQCPRCAVGFEHGTRRWSWDLDRAAALKLSEDMASAIVTASGD